MNYIAIYQEKAPEIWHRINSFRQKYQGNEEANAVLDEEQREIELYRNYSDYYGYVFYIMQK
ncbi:hypothetical protein NIES2119_07370 [[Phormidium ambiguum] IAM M-71]|uniref:Uncharacterized protein n=1 Tax=[Phormidium ambiguum] IAM M-71 TaxID=454136 RepID=A0A1U7INU6_9CYAN|nr:hypothetical protein NIES2119_07370 [Phormidium ambiguum IAM M-71]